MDGQADTLTKILELSHGLNAAGLRELKGRLANDPTTHEKLFRQDVETRFQVAKNLWAALDMDGNRQNFKEYLQNACAHAKSLWAAIDTLEQFEAWRARTETRTKLQAAFDGGLTFQKATIDGEAFHVDDGQVVEGQAVVSEADIPF